MSTSQLLPLRGNKKNFRNEMKDTLLLECNAKLPKLESRTLQGTNVEVPSNVLTRMFQVMLARDLSKPAVEELCDA